MMKMYLKSVSSVALTLLLYYLLQVLVTAVFAMIGGMGAGNIPAAMEEYVYANASLISAAFNGALILLIALLYGRRAPSRAEALTLRPLPRGGYWPVLVCALSTACFLSLALTLMPLPQEVANSYAQQVSQGAGEALAVRLLSTALLAPVAEELLFRLVIYSQLKPALPKAAAMVITCAVFGLMHGMLLWAAYAFLMGLCLMLVYDLYGSILAPILFHIAFNLAGMFIMPMLSLESAATALALLLGSGAAAIACIRPMRRAAGPGFTPSGG